MTNPKKGCLKDTFFLPKKVTWIITKHLQHRFITPPVFMGRTHAKFALVEGENGMKVTILTSQNLTRGNRYESAVILCDDNVFDTLKRQMQEVINNKTISFNDYYRRQIEDY